MIPFRRSNPSWFASLLLFAMIARSGIASPADGEDRLKHGATLYRNLCASCHGERGEGVPEHYARPLTGDSSLRELTHVIDTTMPEGDPSACDGPDAEAVAAYIYEQFYSDKAQTRNNPPRIGLARLTANQLRQSLADIYTHFAGDLYGSEKRGIKAIYFNGARWKNENKKIERFDPEINFDFGHDSPGEGIEPKAFYIYWQGGLIANSTGKHEIVVRSSTSFVMDFGKLGRKFIDNHVQSGDKTEFRESVTLTAGRVYPFKFDFIQRERKTEQPPARISLSWVPPGGLEEIIPAQQFVPDWSIPTFSPETLLPPDDRSYGFERGVAINRQWDDSTTGVAVEFGLVASEELWPEFKKKNKNQSDENRGLIRSFLKELASIAFRGEVDEVTMNLYVNRQVDETEADAEAIQKSVLLILKSPRFLYPLVDSTQSKSQRAANRIALTLFDSLPASPSLLKKIQNKKLEEESAIRQLARESMNDFRSQAKLRDLFYEWLNIKQPVDLTKNAERYPGFDPQLVSDLRHSLDAFLDDIATSPDADYRQLFLADWSYTTDRLASFYGGAWDGEGPSSSVLKKTRRDPSVRLGVLTHPYLMSRLSHSDVTSPVHRGVFLIRFLLGRTLRPPAEAIAPLSPDLHPNMTTRERVSLQTSPESCQVCHSKINPLGFGLENFDAVGKFRSEEHGKGIDTLGRYTNRQGEEVVLNGPKELAEYLANSEDAQRAFINRAFLHFVKQPMAAFGMETQDELLAKFRASQFNIRELIVEIAVIAATRDSNFKP